jgi:thiol-disulfide isomerase/thioredoxin
MPVLILRERCDDSPRCYAAGACPNQAILFDAASEQVVVLPERCGDCRGPCQNFCDRYALKFAPSMEELRLLQGELDGTMTAEAIAQERLRLKQAEDARRQAEQIPEITAAGFQQEVLQARLPVLLLVDTPRSTTWKQLAPVLQQMAQHYVGQLLIRRVNSDTERQLVSALRVRSVPSMLLLYQAQMVDAVEGAMSPTQLQGWIQSALEQLRGLEAGQAPGPAPAKPAGPAAPNKERIKRP